MKDYLLIMMQRGRIHYYAADFIVISVTNKASFVYYAADFTKLDT
jgi:hypothetical protein